MNKQLLQKEILEGIPEMLPEQKTYDPAINHAPDRKQILNQEEKKLSLKNALLYYKPELQATLAP